MSSWFARGPPKPTPGFHAIDIDSLGPPPARSSAPGAPAGAEATIGKPEEVMAAIRIQTGLRMHQARRTAQGLREARVHFRFVCELYVERLQRGRLLLHEHPAGASSWQELFIRHVMH